MEGQGRLEQIYTWVRTHPFGTDVLLALALWVALIVVPGIVGIYFGSRSSIALIALIVPIAWRRTHPVSSAAVIATLAVLQLTHIEQVYPADAIVLVSLYSLTAYGPRWAARIGLLVCFGGVLVAGTRFYNIPTRYTPLLAGFVGGLVLATWALGTMRRLRHREEERLTERARLLEVERAQEARLAATDERARIAREMHDVVAHSLSVTISQADGGRYAARNDPQAAITALETISATGRQALADMRVLLGVLRQDDDQALAPQPDIDAIPGMVKQVASGGLEINLEINGEARPLAAGPSLAAYRIVQEALTNVLKHGGPQARAAVHLTWMRAGLEIWVLDDGRGAGASPAPGGPGQGLIGMRERATLHSGELEAGPRQGGGWQVHALLPYRSES